MITQRIKKVLLSIALAFGMVSVLLIVPAGAVPGDLDPTFDGDATMPGYPGNGKVTTDFNSVNDFGEAVAIQSDGKIVVAGTAQNAAGNIDFAVSRYNTDGSLDNSFGLNGKVMTDINDGHDFASAIVIDGDGNIFVGGQYDNGSDFDFAVVKYLSDGTLDTSFSNDGIETVGYSGYDDFGVDMVIQSDKKIVLAGRSVYTGGAAISLISVARFHPNGGLDTNFMGDPTSFNYPGNGIVGTTHSSQSILGFSVALQSNGKIIVAGGVFSGTNDNRIVLVRYHTDGSLDVNFDGDNTMLNYPGNGILEFKIGPNTSDYATAVEVQPNDWIVYGGNSDYVSNDRSFLVGRLHAHDGSKDTTFGTNGTNLANPTAWDYDHLHDLEIDPSGNILLAGQSKNSAGDNDFSVVRYFPDGKIDWTFGNQGFLLVDFGGNEKAAGIAVQADKKIVIAGHTNNSSDNDFAVARVQGLLSVYTRVTVTSLGYIGTQFSDVLFPAIALTGEDVTISTISDWQVSDTSNTGAGWHITLQADDFSDGEGHTLIVDSFFITLGPEDILIVDGNEPPLSLVQSPTWLNPDGVTILSADPGTGMGIYGVAPTFSLDIPGLTTYAGNYATTIDVTTAAGP